MLSKVGAWCCPPACHYLQLHTLSSACGEGGEGGGGCSACTATLGGLASQLCCRAKRWCTVLEEQMNRPSSP